LAFASLAYSVLVAAHNYLSNEEFLISDIDFILKGGDA